MPTINSVALAETENTAVALPGGVDPLLAYANSIAPQHIIGELLKFSKGDYIAGADDIIPHGALFTANVDEFLAGWIKWQDGRPVEHFMVRVSDGVQPMKRNELGDDDPTEWEVDNNGQPKDPWQFSNYLPLMSADGTLYTFTTSSRGGLGAVGDLVRRYSRHRHKHPDVHAVIALDVDAYEHKNKSYGRIKFPQFTPMGWEPKSKFNEALAGIGVAVAEVAPAAADPADAMNDEIPF